MMLSSNLGRLGLGLLSSGAGGAGAGAVLSIVASLGGSSTGGVIRIVVPVVAVLVIAVIIIIVFVVAAVVVAKRKLALIADSPPSRGDRIQNSLQCVQLLGHALVIGLDFVKQRHGRRRQAPSDARSSALLGT
ncbi:hypothetical protein FB451DRAFT_1222289 [Mycena latifolia]|nr:hypothetical protein FB451DRAFT_1222289 [Mycena latifolia]